MDNAEGKTEAGIPEDQAEQAQAQAENTQEKPLDVENMTTEASAEEKPISGNIIISIDKANKKLAMLDDGGLDTLSLIQALQGVQNTLLRVLGQMTAKPKAQIMTPDQLPRGIRRAMQFGHGCRR